MTSIVLGKYIDGKLEYRGHVSLGVSGSSYAEVLRLPRIPESPFDSPVPPGNEGAVWVSPTLTCAVDYMQRNPDGGMRQPVWEYIGMICLKQKDRPDILQSATVGLSRQ